MSATVHLAATTRKKYGLRPDHRRKYLRRLFKQIESKISAKTTSYSDKHPYYKPIIDKLFPLNHTLAMLRANINRLIRKTWCTTKCPHRLRDHLTIYISVHNTILRFHRRFSC